MRYPAKETAVKHERIVKEASRLFRERGFANVSVGRSDEGRRPNARGVLCLFRFEGRTEEPAAVKGIAVDESENIYVSNSTSNNITVYNPSGTLINTLN